MGFDLSMTVCYEGEPEIKGSVEFSEVTDDCDGKFVVFCMKSNENKYEIKSQEGGKELEKESILKLMQIIFDTVRDYKNAA